MLAKVNLHWSDKESELSKEREETGNSRLFESEKEASGDWPLLFLVKIIVSKRFLKLHQNEIQDKSSSPYDAGPELLLNPSHFASEE